MHEIVAVYLSFGNLRDNAKTHNNSIKLATLCKGKDFDRQKVYVKIVEDLTKLESERIKVTNEHNKVGLLFCVGYNLGSHSLESFVKNFSTSKHFCRLSLITRDDLHT